ncbi:MAG: hypothetical protein ABJG78_19735 [Cyclobacteriaceae bacterium]
MKKLLILLLVIPICSFAGGGKGDGTGFPSKKWFVGFGNSPIFTGLRFNFKDRDVEKVNGMSFTMWQPKNGDGEGAVNGVSLGLPLAGGTAERNGLNLGLAGISANQNLNGLNVGGFGAGAGNNANGINVGGIGVGSGGNLNGLNLAGIGVGSGDDVTGLNFAAIGVGAGGDLKGVSFAGIGAGAGGDVKGVNVALVGMGAGDDMTGINFGGVGMGAGGTLKGINIGGVGVGAGDEVMGVNVAIVGVGAPEVKGISMASVVGGDRIVGIAIAPAWLKVGEKGDSVEDDTELKGLAISAFNQIRGENNGLSIGVLNIAEGGKGFQLGILNHYPNNPKGLRWLPIFNANFNKE